MSEDRRASFSTFIPPVIFPVDRKLAGLKIDLHTGVLEMIRLRKYPSNLIRIMPA